MFLNTSVGEKLRAKVLKLYISLFVDFEPHEQNPSENAFVVYRSNRDYLYERRKAVKEEIQEDMPKLYQFLFTHMDDFLLDHLSHILRPFDIEVVKLCHYLMRYNLFVDKDIQKWIKTLFQYLVTILRKLIKQSDINAQSDLSDTIDKNEINEGFSRELPVERGLFNIHYSFVDSLSDIQTYDQSKDSTIKPSDKLTLDLIEGFTKHVLCILHYFADLRETFLATNLVEFFHLNVYKKHENDEGLTLLNMSELSKLALLHDFSE